MTKHLESERQQVVRPQMNPWLIWLGAIAGVGVLVGLVGLFGSEDPLLFAVGLGLGLTWITTGAICWQVKQQSTSLVK